MAMTGRCYCGAVQYKAEGQPAFAAQCHCRECQYISGGGPNYIVGIPEAAFAYSEGAPAKFKRADLEAGATREFCGTCGTHILTRAPGAPGIAILKVGTLDDPSVFKPQMAMQLADKQPFHHVPEGLAAFQRFPG